MNKERQKENAEQSVPAKTPLIGTQDIIEFAMNPCLNFTTKMHLSETERVFQGMTNAGVRA